LESARTSGVLVEHPTTLPYRWHDTFTLTSAISFEMEPGSGADLDTVSVRRCILSRVLTAAALENSANVYDVSVVAPRWNVTTLDPDERISLKGGAFTDIVSVTVHVSRAVEDVGVFVPASNLEDDAIVNPPTAGAILAQVGVAASGPPPSYPLGTASQLPPEDVAHFRHVVDALWKTACASGSLSQKDAHDNLGSTPGDFKMALDAATVRARCPQLWDGLVKGTEQPLVLLRRTDAQQLSPGPMWIPWHVDVTASRTVQIPLSCATECRGGRFMYVDGDDVHVHPRQVGVPTLHHASLVHAVTPLTSGVRYSMFFLF
jgi:hypothetical protein